MDLKPSIFDTEEFDFLKTVTIIATLLFVFLELLSIIYKLMDRASDKDFKPRG